MTVNLLKGGDQRRKLTIRVGLILNFLDIVTELHDLVRIYVLFSFLQAGSNGTNQRSLAQTVYELEASKKNL